MARCQTYYIVISKLRSFLSYYVTVPGIPSVKVKKCLSLRKKISFLVYQIMTFPFKSIVRNVRNSKFNKKYMELCRELSPFVGISVTEIHECAYLH